MRSEGCDGLIKFPNGGSAPGHRLPVTGRRDPRPHFKLAADGRKVHCPAGKAMHGPKAKGKGVNRWTGDGCRACSLRDRCCTPGLKYRTYTASPAFEKARSEMRARLTTPEGRAAYGARMATIEPIFASLESDMGFRRASSRHAQTVLAEVLLKLLAHNLGRLVATRTHRRLFCAWLTLEEF